MATVEGNPVEANFFKETDEGLAETAPNTPEKDDDTTKVDSEICYGYFDDICKGKSKAIANESPKENDDEDEDSTVYNAVQQKLDDAVPQKLDDDSSYNKLHENYEVVLDPTVELQKNARREVEEEKKSEDADIPMRRQPSTMEIQKDLEILEASRKVSRAAAAPAKSKNVVKPVEGKKQKKGKKRFPTLFKKSKKAEKTPPKVEKTEPVKPVKPKATWKVVKDEKSGKPYYYHRQTRETTWDQPAEYKAYKIELIKYRVAMKKYNEALSKNSEAPIEAKKPDEEKKETKTPDTDESQPFDEPLELAGNRTSTTLTEKTQRIKNTNKRKTNILPTLSEDDHSSISSTPATLERIPVQRERSLMVEDLGTSRIAAEVFDREGGRIVKGRAASEDYDDDYDEDDDIENAYDEISGVEKDQRKQNFDQARRRALDDAIEREDWDLAAALSEGLGSSTEAKYIAKMRGKPSKTQPRRKLGMKEDDSWTDGSYDSRSYDPDF